MREFACECEECSNFSNYESKLDNVFLQCEKNLKEVREDQWTEDKSAQLKEQIMALKSSSDPVRLLASKSHDKECSS